MPALSSPKIKFKYEEVDWSEFKLSIQKKIEEDSKDKTFYEKYKITERDFLIFKEKAFDLDWLTNQEKNSIFEFDKSSEKRILFLFHRFRFSFMPKARITPSVPSYVLIEPSSICNMRCPMCFQTDKSFTTKDYMGKIEIDFFKSIIDECHKEGVGALTLASRGEPTLHPDLIDMLNYVKGKFFEVKINTNASRLNTKLSEAIISSVNHVVFSIDSHISKEYEVIRKGGKFDNVLNNVKEFWRIRNSEKFSSKKLRVSISGIKVYDSQDPVGFRKFWESYADDAYLNPAEERWDTYNNKSDDALKQSCIYPWERLYIWHDGVVNTCDVDYKSFLSPGNLKNGGSMINCWKELNKLRNIHLKGERTKILPCDRCGVSHPVKK